MCARARVFFYQFRCFHLFFLILLFFFFKTCVKSTNRIHQHCLCFKNSCNTFKHFHFIFLESRRRRRKPKQLPKWIRTEFLFCFMAVCKDISISMAVEWVYACKGYALWVKVWILKYKSDISYLQQQQQHVYWIISLLNSNYPCAHAVRANAASSFSFLFFHSQIEK